MDAETPHGAQGGSAPLHGGFAPFAGPEAATREAGLARLKAFVPRAGAAYRRQRNHDRGPEDRSNVSGLSPWIRRRLVREDEVCRAVLAAHTLATAEKFISEVCWRTYFKGWLEQRPAVWRAYREDVVGALAALDRDAGTRARYEDAVHGRTGIACFDAWARELVETGWLHNHARMWFASMWMFTLKLPWALGADFFYRHLLDGDPASNTLSWRWVGGLHTPGKTYLARSDNIAANTAGRFEHTPGLATRASPVEGLANPPLTPLPPADPPPAGPVLLVITEEDLHPESWDFGVARPQAAVALAADHDRSPLATSRLVTTFGEAALQDACGRAAAAFGLEPIPSVREGEAPALVETARAVGARAVVTTAAPVGPVHDRLEALAPALHDAGAPLRRLRRAWDVAFWPHATKGFFALKTHIPRHLEALGVASGRGGR